MSYQPGSKIGGLTEAEAIAFLAEPWNARLGTLGPDGWPHIAPVWYEFVSADRTFLVVGRERADWVAHIRRDPRVALGALELLRDREDERPFREFLRRQYQRCFGQ